MQNLYAKGVNAKCKMQNAKLTKRYGRGGGIQGYALMIYRLATDAYRLRYLASFVVSDRQIANIHAFSVMMVEDGAGDTRLCLDDIPSCDG